MHSQLEVLLRYLFNYYAYILYTVLQNYVIFFFTFSSQSSGPIYYKFGVVTEGIPAPGSRVIFHNKGCLVA